MGAHLTAWTFILGAVALLSLGTAVALGYALRYAREWTAESVRARENGAAIIRQLGEEVTRLAEEARAHEQVQGDREVAGRKQMVALELAVKVLQTDNLSDATKIDTLEKELLRFRNEVREKFQ